jgi:lipid-binding SYLF domain-containing protein
MLNVAATKSGLFVVCLSLLLTSCASTKTPEEAHTAVTEADTTLKHFLSDPDMTWLQQNFARAKGVMVCPDILQAGFIVGGSGGTCVVHVRDQSGAGWNGPAFYKIGTGSLGLQAGAQKSEMIALIMNDKARDSLLSSSFKFGGDVSVAAGPVGTGAGGQIQADMVSFVRSKGLYGGLNLEGSSITVDETSNTSYYGKAATPVDILVKKAATSPTADPMKQTLSGK